MAVAVLDTNVFFAATSARDAYHEPAREILGGVDQGDLPEAIVTDYVLAETLNLTRERLGPDVATGLLDRLGEGTHFEIDHAARAVFQAAQPLFRQNAGLSFVDATTVAYMRRRNVECLYSFDDDFDAISSITRLETADDPFD